MGDIYHGMGMHDAETGRLVCSAVPSNGVVDAKDRLYFRIARDTGRFSIGEYQIGRVSQKPGINFGYPLVVGEETVGVAFVALDLGAFHSGASRMPLPADVRFVVLDGNGTVLARSPEAQFKIGEKLPMAAVWNFVQSASEGAFDAPGHDGKSRWFAYDTIAANYDGSNALKIVVSIPRNVIFGESNRNLARNITGITLSLLFLFLVARYGVDRFFLRNIRKLLRTAARVKAEDLTARTGMRSTEDELSQIGAAFDDMAHALQERDKRLQRALQDLRYDAVTDALTGLHNRRHLGEYLPRELARAARGGDKLALLLFDLDHFKSVNDTFGHSAGDAVLTGVANILKSNIRAGDAVFRHGGEEFLVVLPETDVEGARQKAEALRSAIAEVRLEHAGRALGRQTASCGVAVFPLNGVREDELMRCADQALYAAKEAGRDRVVVAMP